MRKYLLSLLLVVIAPVMSFASEANLKIPELSADQNQMLIYGIFVCLLGVLFGIYQFMSVKKLPAHKSMLEVSQVIFETCKTYLLQQGKFLFILFVFIGACIAFYFGVLQQESIGGVLLILMWTVIGILRIIWCCMVRYQNEYSCQQQNGFCIS